MAPSRTFLTALTAAGALLLAGTAPALASLPKALTQGRPAFAVRPAQISYTGDGTGVLGGGQRTGDRGFGRITWSSWTRRAAHGRGKVWIDDCQPDCAGGTFKPRPMRVALSKPRGGKYRLLTIRYRYRGKAYVDRRTVVRQGRYWTYGIAG